MLLRHPRNRLRKTLSILASMADVEDAAVENYAEAHLQTAMIKECELRAPFAYLFGKDGLARFPWATTAFAS